MRELRASLWTIAVAVCAGCTAPGTQVEHQPAQEPESARLIVLTDIGADPDDTQSLVRLLLYSNDIDIEGMVATTSVHHPGAPEPDRIQVVLDAYEEVLGNLRQHDPDYPEVAFLRSVTASGQSGYGIEAVGLDKTSAGAELIVDALEAPDPRPVWISVWGGPNTLAQALLQMRLTLSASEFNRLAGKLRVYAIADQDNSGAWIRREFPGLFYIVSPGDYDSSTWIGITNAPPGSGHEISDAWIAENIQQDHGPLGSCYPDVVYGMEGDTPAFLSLVPNGLNVPERPDWGGWGGRYQLYRPDSAAGGQAYTAGVPIEPETRPIWTDAVDEYVDEAGNTVLGNQATIWRWRPEFQNDLAARMDWTVQPYAAANHPPNPLLSGLPTIKVKAGDRIVLDASGSTDPDGDDLRFEWFDYTEAGTLGEPIGAAIQGPQATFTAPSVAADETVHIILRVTDDGDPPLTRYARVIVRIVP